jgi:hypothetical protein
MLQVAVKWLPLLLGVQEVPGIKLGPKIGYHNLEFPWFYSGPETNSWIAVQIRPWSLPSTSFPIYYSLTVQPFNDI